MTLKFKDPSNLKPVLGAYAAMARNNAFLTIMDIMDQIHVRQKELIDRSGKKADPESSIWMLDIFPRNSRLLPEQEARAARLLRSHFPFLDLTADLKDTDDGQGTVVKGNCSYEDLCGAFLAMIEVLTHLRDLNLHYKINDEKVSDFYFRRAEVQSGLILRDILKASPRKIKERFKGTGLLDEGSMRFFLDNNYIRQGKKYTFNQKWEFNPQRRPLPSEGRVLKGGQPVIDKFTGKPRSFERLSSFGEVLLISLFTEKRYIPDFLRDCGLEENFSTAGTDGKMSQNRVMREIISAYCIRLPERKLDIESSATQIMLDMLNELSRCPSELYDVLPESEKRAFDVTGSDASQVLMKRYSDRYVPLVLKYFDTTEAFRKLRFQVNTGQLRYEFHGMKEYMDGVGRIRIVQEGINGFGRIQEMEAKRTGSDSYLGFPLLQTDEDGRMTDMPYITDSAARYVLNGDLIGLSINGDSLPVVEAVMAGADMRYKVRNRQPDCWLSRFELPALAFYTYLSRKYHVQPTAEDIIGDAVREYRDFFTGVAEGRITSMDGVRIPRNGIPEKLIHYLEGIPETSGFQEFKEGMVSLLVADTQERLSRLETDLNAMGARDNKIGKKSFVRIRPGKLAEFIAEDIVRFQGYPEGHPEARLTGQQYSVLQGMLATFADGLQAACLRAGLLDGESAHPFLSRVFRLHGQGMASTVDLYRAYLEERLAYLKGPIPDTAPFLHPERKKWTAQKDADYYRALAGRYVKDEKTGEVVGIFLPRGLFDKPVRDMISAHSPKTAAVIQAAERVNMAFIILTYIENELDDQNQGFYYEEGRLKEYGFCRKVAKEKEEHGPRRLYAILRKEKEAHPDGLYFKALNEEVGGFRDDGRKAAPLDRDTEALAGELKKSYRRMCDNEKAIRRYMVQDITMFLLARSLVSKAGSSVNLWSVGPEGKGILDQKVDVVTRFGKYLIRQEGISIKDYGEIYKILKDKRIDTLLRSQEKAGDMVVQLEDIKEELVTYNRKRAPVVKTIQEYEKGVYEANSEVFAGKTDRFGFKDILDADRESSPLKKEAVRQVRNAFSHNQYPKRTVTTGEDRMELFKPDLPNMAKEIHENTGKLINGEKES